MANVTPEQRQRVLQQIEQERSGLSINRRNILQTAAERRFREELLASDPALREEVLRATTRKNVPGKSGSTIRVIGQTGSQDASSQSSAVSGAQSSAKRNLIQAIKQQSIAETPVEKSKVPSNFAKFDSGKSESRKPSGRPKSVEPVTVENRVSGAVRKVGEIARNFGRGLPKVTAPREGTVITAVDVARSGSGSQTIIYRDPRLDDLGPRQKFEKKVSDLNIKLDSGAITQKEANKQFAKAEEEFNVGEAKRQAGATALTGAAYGAASLIPGVGAGLAIAGGTSAFGEIEEIDRLKPKLYPKAIAIGIGAGLAGGLVGSSLAGVGKSIRIKGDDILDAPIKIIGSERNKFIQEVRNLAPDANLNLKEYKNSNTLVYDVPLTNGGTYRIVEFSKGSSLSGGEKVIYGFKLKDGVVAGDRILGSSIVKQTGELSSAYTDIVRFSTQRRSADILSILERSTSNSSRVNPRVRKVVSQSEARLLSRKAASDELLKKARSLFDKIEKGGKLTTKEAKDLLNLDRRRNGLKPFTDEEFARSTNPTAVSSRLNNIIFNAKQTENISKESGTIVAKRIGEVREFGLGFARVKKIPEVRLKATSSVAKRRGTTLRQLKRNIKNLNKPKMPAPKLKSTNLFSRKSRSRTVQKQITKTKQRSTIGGGPSAAVQVAITTPRVVIKRIPSPLSLTSARLQTSPSLGRVGSTSKIRASEFEDFTFKTKIKFDQLSLQSEGLKDRSRLKASSKSALSDRVSPSQVVFERNVFRDRQDQGQLQKLRQSQRQRQRQASRNLTPSRPTTPNLKVPGLILIPKGKRIEKGKLGKSKVRIKPKKFDVFTRKGKRLNKTPLSLKSAEAFGKIKTDLGIKASFFLRETKRPGFIRSRSLERKGAKLASKFRPSKRTPGLIVEKRKYRLEAKGRTREVKEIRSFRKVRPSRFGRKR